MHSYAQRMCYSVPVLLWVLGTLTRVSQSLPLRKTQEAGVTCAEYSAGRGVAIRQSLLRNQNLKDDREPGRLGDPLGTGTSLINLCVP